MNKYMLILSMAGLLLCGVAVNSIANFSGVPTANINTNNEVNTSKIVTYNASKKGENTAMVGSTISNSSVSLSMLMIGFMLVGLASYRERK